MEKYIKGKVVENMGNLTGMKCPNCGKNVTTPIKEWDLSPKVRVKLYECCGKKFREYVSKK